MELVTSLNSAGVNGISGKCFSRASTRLAIVFAIANLSTVCTLLGQDKAQIATPIAVHALDSDGARRAIQGLDADARKRTPLRLEGTIILQNGSVPQSGTIIVEISQKSDWRETVTINGQTSTESHIRGVRSALSHDGQQKSFALPQIETDLLPMQAVLKRANDTAYAVTDTSLGVGTKSRKSHYVFRPKASIGVFNPLGSSRTSSTLDFASFEADMDPNGSKVEAIRRFDAVLPAKPEYASFCRDKDGSPLAHPALKSIPANLDCSLFRKLVSVPIETRYSDYSASDFGLIPRTIERYTSGTLTASIHITTIAPLTTPFPSTEEKH